jgi:hypothetical protein
MKRRMWLAALAPEGGRRMRTAKAPWWPAQASGRAENGR